MTRRRPFSPKNTLLTCSYAVICALVASIACTGCGGSSGGSGSNGLDQNQSGDDGGGTLETIELSTSEATLFVGATLPVSATGFYADGSAADLSEDAQWSASDPGVVQITPGSPILIDALGLGETTLQADLNGIASNVLVVTVSADVDSLSLDSFSSSLEVGDTIEITVTGTLSGGDSIDLSLEAGWTITNPGVIEVASDSPALLTAVGVGSSELIANYGGIASQPVTVQVTGAANDYVWTSSVTQFGITWTFDQDYRVGQFVNGDYWVWGPVNIIRIEPRSQNVNGRIQHGSMVNVKPGTSHGWDNKLYDNKAADWYKSHLNRAFNVTPSNPLNLQPGKSLVSSITKTDPTQGKQNLKTAAVLTVLGSPPPSDSFRPPYAGGQKPLYRLSQVKKQLLRKLPPIADTPDPDEVAKSFERVWLEHSNWWIVRYQHPEDNMPWYGRDMAEVVGQAALLLNVDLPISEKRLLLIRFLQVGIDFDALRSVGLTWPASGGHMNGRKFPIVFKRAMFGENPNLGNDPTRFSEDDQTFFVEETSPGVFNHGFPNWNNPRNDPDQCVGVHPYGSGQLGMPEWSFQHWSDTIVGQRDPGHTWSDGPIMDCNNDNHRFCCTYRALVGHLLTARIMNLRGAWNWPPAFDYMDRYMQIATGSKRAMNAWQEAMWDTYRGDYGSYPPISTTWIPADAGH